MTRIKIQIPFEGYLDLDYMHAEARYIEATNTMERVYLFRETTVREVAKEDGAQALRMEVTQLRNLIKGLGYRMDYLEKKSK